MENGIIQIVQKGRERMKMGKEIWRKVKTAIKSRVYLDKTAKEAIQNAIMDPENWPDRSYTIVIGRYPCPVFMTKEDTLKLKSWMEKVIKIKLDDHSEILKKG